MAESIWNRTTEEALIRALRSLTDSVKELGDNTKAQTAWFRSHVDSVTLRDLKEMENRMAETAEEYAAAMIEQATKGHQAVEGLRKDVAKQTKAIEELKALIAAGAGGLTPAVKAKFDEALAGQTSLTERLVAFDAEIVDEPPAEPPVEPPVEPPTEARRNR